jgi:vacuolar-type H+-ATPase subunit C/Vma6
VYVFLPVIDYIKLANIKKTKKWKLIAIIEKLIAAFMHFKPVPIYIVIKHFMRASKELGNLTCSEFVVNGAFNTQPQPSLF